MLDRTLWLLASLSIAIVLGVGCSDEPGEPVGTGRVELRLVDAPVAFDDVILDVQAVRVHRANADTADGWFDLESEPGAVHLLDLVNGESIVLGAGELPEGFYNQIRLVLGPDNVVVVDGADNPLSVPSGQQSGYKIQHEFEVVADETYGAIMDIDAARSVHLTGSDVYVLRPVLRVCSERNVGHIDGTVLPLEAEPIVWTVDGLDTVQTFADSESGAFRLMALPDGVYDVRFSPTMDGWLDSTVADVPVVPMQVTEMDTVVLEAMAR
jgi:hypothetical protein